MQAKAQESGAADGTPAAEIARAAEGWLDRLDRVQTGAARFAFDSAERKDWHYTPRRRPGLPLRDMTPEQREAARGMLQAVLSERGVLKVEAIMALEAVLRRIEGSSRSFRDPENYAFAVFGRPGEAPWGWRVEGHHLSINVTLSPGGEVSVTPAFTGSNPARIPEGEYEGKRIQEDEYFLALELAQSLSEEQRAAAVLAESSLGNIVAGPGRAEALEKPEGIPFAELTADQQELLLRLVETYVGLARDAIGRPYMALVRDGLDETRFAWAGGMEEGAAFYYRVHGPRVLIEFDNTQNNANHIHSLWRDPVNDFGRDDLGEHYRDADAEHGHGR